MRILVIGTLLVLYGFYADCQTLGETELWIADKLESHPFNIQNKRDADVTWSDITTEVDFETSGYLFISETRYYKTRNQPPLQRSHIVPIKHMKSIIYKFGKDYVEVEFGIKSGVSAGQNMILTEIYDKYGVVRDSENVDRFNIILGRSFLQDKMPNRFRKAIDLLIEFHGGEIVSEAL